MKLCRLTSILIAAAALLPLAPAHAQGTSPFDAPPVADFGGGGRFSGVPDRNGNVVPAAPTPPSPFSSPPPPSVAASKESFTDLLATGAFHQHPRPMAWSGSSAAIAGSLPVSSDVLTLTLYGQDTVRGVVEARIATSRGIFYMFDSLEGAQTIAADAITSVAHLTGLAGQISPSAAGMVGTPVSGTNVFAAEHARERSLAARSVAQGAHQSVVAANQASSAYARRYPGSISTHAISHGTTIRGTRRTYMPFYGHPASGGGFAAGPGDSGGHDYARAGGDPNDPVLSTGWTSGHGRRTQHVSSYYRHTKSGGIVHVHSYYRRHR